MKSNMIIKDIVFVFLMVSCAVAIASQPGYQAVLNNDLLIAIKKVDLALVSKLLELRADANTKLRDEYPLIEAARVGNCKAVELLCDAKADVEVKNYLCDTALVKACRENRREVVEYLIKVKADVNARTFRQETILHWASRWSHLRSADYTQVVLSLLQAKADCCAVNAQGETPFFSAVDNKHKVMMTLLLQAKSDINHRNNEGKTPLYYALCDKKNNGDMAHLLVDLGADLGADEQWNTEHVIQLRKYAWAKVKEALEKHASLGSDLITIIRTYYLPIEIGIHKRVRDEK